MGTPYRHGRCKLHGGASPTHVKAAQRREAERAVALYGLPRDVEPHDTLLEEVHRTAGHVAWLAEVVGQLDPQQVVHGVVRTVQGPGGSRTVEARAVLNPWVKLYQEERDRLVRVAKAAIDAGVAERQVRITEEQAQQLASRSRRRWIVSGDRIRRVDGRCVRGRATERFFVQRLPTSASGSGCRKSRSCAGDAAGVGAGSHAITWTASVWGSQSRTRTATSWRAPARYGMAQSGPTRPRTTTGRPNTPV